MMLHEHELKRAAQLLAKCEKDLGYALSQGQTSDLLCDNICDEWSIDKCRAVSASLHATHGVGAFHRAEARNAQA